MPCSKAVHVQIWTFHPVKFVEKKSTMICIRNKYLHKWISICSHLPSMAGFFIYLFIYFNCHVQYLSFWICKKSQDKYFYLVSHLLWGRGGRLVQTLVLQCHSTELKFIDRSVVFHWLSNEINGKPISHRGWEPGH